MRVDLVVLHDALPDQGQQRAQLFVRGPEASLQLLHDDQTLFPAGAGFEGKSSAA